MSHVRPAADKVSPTIPKGVGASWLPSKKKPVIHSQNSAASIENSPRRPTSQKKISFVAPLYQELVLDDNDSHRTLLHVFLGAKLATVMLTWQTRRHGHYTLGLTYCITAVLIGYFQLVGSLTILPGTTTETLALILLAYFSSIFSLLAAMATFNLALTRQLLQQSYALLMLFEMTSFCLGYAASFCWTASACCVSFCLWSALSLGCFYDSMSLQGRKVFRWKAAGFLLLLMFVAVCLYFRATPNICAIPRQLIISRTNALGSVTASSPNSLCLNFNSTEDQSQSSDSACSTTEIVFDSPIDKWLVENFSISLTHFVLGHMSSLTLLYLRTLYRAFAHGPAFCCVIQCPLITGYLYEEDAVNTKYLSPKTGSHYGAEKYASSGRRDIKVVSGKSVASQQSEGAGYEKGLQQSGKVFPFESAPDGNAALEPRDRSRAAIADGDNTVIVTAGNQQNHSVGKYETNKTQQSTRNGTESMGQTVLASPHRTLLSNGEVLAGQKISEGPSIAAAQDFCTRRETKHNSTTVLQSHTESLSNFMFPRRVKRRKLVCLWSRMELDTRLSNRWICHVIGEKAGKSYLRARMRYRCIVEPFSVVCVLWGAVHPAVFLLGNSAIRRNTYFSPVIAGAMYVEYFLVFCNYKLVSMALSSFRYWFFLFKGFSCQVALAGMFCWQRQYTAFYMGFTGAVIVTMLMDALPFILRERLRFVNLLLMTTTLFVCYSNFIINDADTRECQHTQIYWLAWLRGNTEESDTPSWAKAVLSASFSWRELLVSNSFGYVFLNILNSRAALWHRNRFAVLTAPVILVEETDSELEVPELSLPTEFPPQPSIQQT